MTDTGSRRHFLRSSLGASALAVAGSALPLLGGCASAQPTSSILAPAPGARFARKGTFINYNEYPLGPCESAREALVEIIGHTGFYRFDLIQHFHDSLAAHLGVDAEQVILYPGSGWALELAPRVFTSAERSLVVADPSYEACEQVAKRMGTPVHRVPLLANGAHDLTAMCAFPDAGLIYVCNPNNPTGTITPREAIVSALANKPAGAILLVDEAYIHFSEEQSVIDLVASHPDLIVLHTFAKLYGMAGLRCGFAVGQGEALAKLREMGSDAISVTAAVAAQASIEDEMIVAERRAYNSGVRNDVIRWLQARGIECTVSHTNCFMMDVGRPGKDVAAAMASHGVHVGRSWPSWPNWVRVSVGTREDMEAFKTAFAAVQEQGPLAAAVACAPELRLCTAAALA
ncbi:pyridoxal phosphate-dependent aminotransferase [Halotalea alkalilenta]|uniref:Aminotransferase class I/classII large domain-containing protein n=1 Tax=Halotalea alkalilenta TaxID=376489 RepID=A0A172YJD7_9GAMM|nr:pyridoxal phosphate-dependent aminotransferase [Halotalea alkalilenta]ANF59333.1 hypothetical protein A5892_19270 [Halotalea alkalilenta]